MLRGERERAPAVMNRFLLLFGAALAVSASACGDGATFATPSPCVVDAGRLVADLTVQPTDCRSLRVAADVIVDDGHTLTIAPGTTLVFDPGASLIVGEGSPGNLVAAGTEDAPIRLVSAPDPTGSGRSWGGVVFAGGTMPSSVVEHVIVEGAGVANDPRRGCISVQQLAADVLELSNVELSRCVGPGLVIDRGRVGLSNVTFVDTVVGVSATPDAARNLPELDFGGATRNILLSAPILADTTLRATGVPWDVEGDLVVGGPNRPVLTLDAGVKLRFPADRWLAVGLEEPGALRTTGDDDAVVELTSFGDTARWHGVVLGPHTSEASLAQTRIGRAGAAGTMVLGCLSLDVRAQAAVRLSDVRFEDCAIAAIGASESADLAFDVMSGVTIVDAPVGLSVRADVLGSIPETTFVDVPRNVTFGGTVRADATWVAQSIPWRVTNDIRVRGEDAPVLTLGEGLVLEMAADRWIEIGTTNPGALVAEGTGNAPVVLAGANGASWRGLVFGARASAGSHLAHIEVRDGGAPGPNVSGCVSILGGARDGIGIEDSVFADCRQAAIAATTEGFEFATFSRNVIVSSQVGFLLAPSAVASVGSDTRFSDVSANVILGGEVLRSALWAKGELPWTVRGTVFVDGATEPEVTLGAGLELRFEPDASLAIGTTYGGALVASGGTSERVVFTSALDAPLPGSWAGLRFGPMSRTSRLEHTRIAFAGGQSPGHRGGVTLDGTGARVSIRSTSFGSNAMADLYVDCGSTPTLEDNGYGSPVGLVQQTDCN